MSKREKKHQLLGMNVSSANNILKRVIIYNFAQKLGMTNCYHCQQPVSFDDYSIEHKKEWGKSDNPQKAFFDPENIAISHIWCNCSLGAHRHRTNSNGYRGISRGNGHHRNKPWRSSIIKDGKTVYLGYFHTDEEAARAYDKKAVELFGDSALLNFPKEP